MIRYNMSGSVGQTLDKNHWRQFLHEWLPHKQEIQSCWFKPLKHRSWLLLQQSLASLIGQENGTLFTCLLLCLIKLLVLLSTMVMFLYISNPIGLPFLRILLIISVVINGILKSLFIFQTDINTSTCYWLNQLFNLCKSNAGYFKEEQKSATWYFTTVTEEWK